MEYKPTHIILRKYADVLVRFALNSGKGIRKDDVVLITANECAKPLFLELQKAVWRAGGHVISDYHPNNDEFHPEAERNFYTHASKHQLEHFPKHQYAGLVKEIDHQIVILADTDMKALGSIDPKLIMRRTMALKPWREMRNIK